MLPLFFNSDTPQLGKKITNNNNNKNSPLEGKLADGRTHATGRKPFTWYTLLLLSYLVSSSKKKKKKMGIESISIP
jgi:hypothetical protein